MDPVTFGVPDPVDLARRATMMMEGNGKQDPRLTGRWMASDPQGTSLTDGGPLPGSSSRTQ